MNKLTLAAVTTALCSLSLVATHVTPSIAQQQPAVAPAPASAATNPQAQLIEQLKLTKEQQAKLAKLEQSFIQKKTAVLTPTQKEQVLLAMQQGKNPSLTLTTNQKSQLKAIYTSALAEQAAILTTEQKRKLQELNKQYAPKQR